MKVVSEAQVRRGAGRPHDRPPRDRPHLRGLRGPAAREPRPRRSPARSTRTRRCPRPSCRRRRPSTATPSTPRTRARAPGSLTATKPAASQQLGQGRSSSSSTRLPEAQPDGRGEAHQPLPAGQGRGRALPQPRPGGLLGRQRLRPRARRHLHAAHPQPGRDLRARRPAARRPLPVHGARRPGPPAAATSTSHFGWLSEDGSMPRRHLDARATWSRSWPGAVHGRAHEGPDHGGPHLDRRRRHLDRRLPRGLNFACVQKAPARADRREQQVGLLDAHHRADREHRASWTARAAYGCFGEQVDGNDVLAVYEVTRQAIERARAPARARR